MRLIDIRQIFPFSDTGFWFVYALQDIKNRYSRSVLGPLWLSLSILVTVCAMGPLYGMLLNQSGGDYYLYLASGVVLWALVATSLAEGSTAFTSHEVFLKQTNIALASYVMRGSVRNIIIFLHNFLILLFFYIIFGNLSWRFFLIIPISLLIFVILYSISLTLAIVCARFRDLIPLVSNLLQLAMFLTPVFWIVPVSSERQLYTFLNPFFYMLSIFRAPFGLTTFSVWDFFILGVILMVSIISNYFLLNRFKKRIVYWV